MNELAFHAAVDDLFFKIEEWLESKPDLDFESQDGGIKIITEKGSQLILNRQSALQEIWLAAPVGAYHFRLKENRWCTQQGEELQTVLTSILGHPS